jgi:4-amino-4-deoxy-L-arabinose transferase-like glycosyltransferase
VRLAAIDHGFPYIYHADEPAVVRSALAIRFDPNPHHFDWPHLYFYLNYFCYMVFGKVRDLASGLHLQTTLVQLAPVLWNDKLIFYLISRILSATLGALTVVPIYLWVTRLVDKKAGLFGATFLALAPFHVRHSHYALVDVPMVFFLAWSLYFATYSPVLAGLTLGFSASTKYSGLLGGLFIVLYYLLNRSLPLRQRVARVAKLGLFTALGFLIGTPYALLDYLTFVRTDGPQGALWQFTNVGKVDFVSQLQQFGSALTTKLPSDLGYALLPLFVIGCVTLVSKLIKHQPVANILALASVTFIAVTFYVAGLEKDRSHYYMISYPYLLMVSGWALARLSDRLSRRVYKVALISAVLLPSLLLTGLNIQDLTTKSSTTIYGGDAPESAKIKL